MIPQQFLPTGPCPAPLLIIGEAPGQEEVRLKMPFVGASGHELDRMLTEVGLSRSQAFVTNVCRVRPFGNDIAQFVSSRKTAPGPGWTFFQGKWISTEIAEGLSLLQQEISLVEPNLIICFGNLALWAVTGRWGVKSWRGSVLKSLTSGNGVTRKVLCTYHPAAVLRQWSLRPTVIHDLQKAAREYLSPETSSGPSTNFTIRPTIEQVTEVIDRIEAQLSDNNETLKLAPDIETRAGHIACLGFAWSATEAICIPFMDTAHPTGYWSEADEAEVVYRLYKLFTHPRISCVGQNWLYDAQYFWRHWHFIVSQVRDTMIAQHAMFSEGQKSLDYMSSLYNPDYQYWKDEGKKWDPSMSEEQLWLYNCKDCVETWLVDEGQAQARADLVEQGWTKLPEVEAFQQRQFKPVLKMMNRGIRMDTAKRGELAIELMRASAERQEWIDYVVGRPLNVDSPKQMQAFFYEELNQTRNYHRGSPGMPMRVTADDEALEKIALREPMLRPLIARVQEMRSIGKAHAVVQMRLDVDGRIRCSFNVAGTKTYRYSSSKSAFDSGTNLQNITSGDEEEGLTSNIPNIRKLFIPDQGMEMFDIDLASADLQVVTNDSQCVGMKQLIDAGLSAYVEIAKEYYRDPSITKKHPRYTGFKSLCHGTNYRGTAPGLAGRIGLLVSEVERIQKWYFGKFPEILAWQKEVEAQIRGRGWIENVWGNRMYFRDRITDKTINEGVAWKPQSTIAILIDKILVAIDEQLPWCELLLQVHDSLVGQYPSIKGGEARRAILGLAAIPLPYPTPLLIGVGLKTSTRSWGDCS